MLTSPTFHLPRHSVFALACAPTLALALSLASGPVHAQARTLSDRGEMLDRVARAGAPQGSWDPPRLGETTPI